MRKKEKSMVFKYRAPVMPRKRYPHLPIRPKLYEGLNAPASQKTLLTVRQINAFYDTGNTIGHTRSALRQAELAPSAFGPVTPRNGQPPMLFRAGEAKRAIQMANTPPPEFGLITEQDVRTERDRLFEAYQQAKAENAVEEAPTTELPFGFDIEGYTVAAPTLETDTDVPAPNNMEVIRESVEITFNAMVDDESCDDLLQKITDAVDGGAKIITLWISSEGGSLFTALGMYDRLRFIQRVSGVKLYTVATGYVLSAGTILMAAGSRRFSLPHTVFMLHEPYQMPWESGEDAKVLVTEIGERQELHELSLKKIAHIFYERDSRPEADFDSWLDIFRVPTKKYFGAEEACDWGLVDGVL